MSITRKSLTWILDRETISEGKKAIILAMFEQTDKVDKLFNQIKKHFAELLTAAKSLDPSPTQTEF